MIGENLTIALLIDGENLGPKYIEQINQELMALGRVTYKRLYGSLDNKQIEQWRNIANDYSITVCNQYAYSSGKNASDMNLAMDAMDILHRGNVNAFCIMTNDSDFTGLAKRLKEENMFIIGAGTDTAGRSFKNVCDRFFTLTSEENKGKRGAQESTAPAETPKKKDKKPSTKKKPKKEHAEPTPADNQANSAPTAATAPESLPVVKTPEPEHSPDRIATKEEIWSFVIKVFESRGRQVLDSGEIMNKIYQAFPDFDFKNYGVKKSYEFFNGDLFEVVRTENSNINIRLKD